MKAWKRALFAAEVSRIGGVRISKRREDKLKGVVRGRIDIGGVVL